MINELLHEDHPMGEVKLKEVLGHTPRQVGVEGEVGARTCKAVVRVVGHTPRRVGVAELAKRICKAVVLVVGHMPRQVGAGEVGARLARVCKTMVTDV